MKSDKAITFFLLVTDRDCIIADYSIKSYQKIYNENREFGYKDFTLFIYLNCLSPNNKQRYKKKWEQLPYTFVFDNASKFNGSVATPYPGEEIVSPEGIKRNRDDYAESYDELWTTELLKFETRFIATVDADFEILNADFYFYLLHQVKDDPYYIGASSSYSPTTVTYDTYSKRNIILNERNHTWFCIYKKNAFQTSQISHFYYETRASDGAVQAFDSAAYFQHDLRVNHQLAFAVAPGEYQCSFVHYGATSKNKSLTEKNIGFYRVAFINASIGPIHGKPNLKFFGYFNKAIRKLASTVFGNYLKRIGLERTTYIYDDAN